MFLAVFIYFIGFIAVNRLPVFLAVSFPHTVDFNGPMSNWAIALSIELGLVFLQRSGRQLSCFSGFRFRPTFGRCKLPGTQLAVNVGSPVRLLAGAHKSLYDQPR